MASRRIAVFYINKYGTCWSSILRTSQHKILSQPKANLSRLTIAGRFKPRNLIKPLAVGVGASLLGTYVVTQYASSPAVVNAKEKHEHEERELSRREQRFHDFTSCEVNGHVVMTPFDFIESLIENQPKIKRRSKIRLTEKDLKRIRKRTPKLESGSETFFRDLHQDGVITYSEYLFLVTILTKSNVGLRTALKMMDVNGDKNINLEEFRLIERMINSAASCDSCLNADHADMPMTTLGLHLFGEDGKRAVTFDEFFKFCDNMQNEVLELEFHEYSKGLRFISEIDFAEILLRNTTLTEAEHCEYIDRLENNLVVSKGVSMEQFKDFNEFLSNFDDFVIAVNMTNVSGQELDQEFFKRAVQVVTGIEIDSHIIDVVFTLFDRDGDGKLGQSEFFGIMKDRLKRGFGKFPNMRGFQGFKHCLKKEMIKGD